VKAASGEVTCAAHREPAADLDAGDEGEQDLFSGPAPFAWPTASDAASAGALAW
jgi:hypothetical protein